MALKRPALFAACIAVFAALVFVISSYVSDEARPGHAGPLTDPTDLVAFYCGGKGLAERVDPYRAEPQRSCERRAFAESRIRLMEHLVMPETLPPYAIVPFALLSFASFRVACVVFVLGSLAAAMATILIIVRLTRMPIVLVSVATLVSFSLASIYIGQPVPFVVAALCASALALRSGRVALASVLALPTMMEPHIGLAAMLGLFVLERRARIPVAVGVLALAWLSFFVGGLALNLEYLTQVVPAQALSEVANFHAQYSLTALAYQLGLNETAAIRLGECSYALMLGTGLWFAARLKRVHGDAAFAVLTPPACVLVGGVYVHDHLMAVALPFAFSIASYARRRALVLCATMVLAVPWQSVFELFFVSAFPTHVHFDPGTALASVSDGRLLSQISWRVWISLLGGRDGRTPFEMFLFKLPTWLALGTIGFVALRSPTRRREETSSAAVAQPPLVPALRSAIRR
jgi:hypothetical protein